MELYFDDLLSVSRRMKARELSARELTLATIERIDRLDPHLHSAVMVLADTALAEAKRADAEIAAGRWRGPLHGVPLGIKDLLWTRGLPTAAGGTLLGEFRPGEDATVVERLRASGAVIVAKLRMTEGAGFAHHPDLPVPVNPWSAAHWTGISSSGSGVAPAAGLCFGAIGSDTGGSIRMPSAANNLTGIKPTWGRVSRHGVIPLSESFDHIGPMARSVGDAAAILQAIAGDDSRDPTSLVEPVPDYLAELSSPLGKLTLGIDPAFADGTDPAIVAACEGAIAVFRALGARVVDVSFPFSDDEMMAVQPMFSAEIALAHAEHFPSHAEHYGPWLRQTLEWCQAVPGLAVAQSHLVRDRFKGRLRRLFGQVDALLLPAIGLRLPRVDEIAPMLTGEVMLDPRILRFTSPFNVAGTPTVTFPAGFDPDGLPIGIQLAGPWLSEPLLIRAVAAFQRDTEFHRAHPDLSAYH